ncbi:glycosyltransferase [Ancylobacter sp. A5.8]|uniref:rhamnan synthesis F family protein n=1 Tax=Ancylobacter gelatini TaxID=2919920 RepID=UPI001F4D8457|nr:rhamnan synthesis F family protein [Ancylobacter gelatini]MCJ8142803.1 glycosyltransferase [Ancylobacter gelatini]
MKFFGEVARQIDEILAPKTVFDAGCAIGFLVECLRGRGIEAYGRDFSSYAISQVPAGLQAFCECDTLVNPIEGTYDLVTCIEVLEHMSEEDGRRAIANLCAAGSRILFSSSPRDFAEPTHINVQPPLYWMQLFAEHGFGPRAEFDGSFLCPWAILFERRAEAPTQSELEAQARLILARLERADRNASDDGQRRELLGRVEAGLAEVKSIVLSDVETRASAEQRLHAQRQMFDRLDATLKAVDGNVQRCIGQVRSLEAERDQLLATLELQSSRAKLERSEAEIAALRGRIDKLDRRRWSRFWKKLRPKSRSRRGRPAPLTAEEALIEASGLFDAAWYAERYADVPRHPEAALRHFFSHGAGERRDPNPEFSTKWYLETYPHAVASGLHPLLHYIEIGSRSGLKPSPDFDPAWYRKTYPDTVKGGFEPLQHYLSNGKSEGRRRNATDNSRDVAEAMIERVKEPAALNQMALFITHAPAGAIKPHVALYINALKGAGLGVVLIVVADCGDEVDASALVDQVDGLFIRENGGYDFAAWAHVAGLVDLTRTTLLCLVNDSLMGPFSEAALAALMARARASDAELVGMTDNYEFKHHLQSYFLIGKGAGAQTLKAFLDDVRWLDDKQEVIMAYEIQLLDYFESLGKRGAALFPSQATENRTLGEWRELIDEGFPFVKMAVLQTLEPREWRPVLEAQGFDCDIAAGSLAVIRQGREASQREAGSGNSREELQAMNGALIAQVHELTAKRGEAASRVAELENELSKARKRPWKLVVSKMKFRLYKWLGSGKLPLSPRKAAKYALRARRYDPYRSNTQQRAVAPVSSSAMAGSARIYDGRRAADAAKPNVLVVSHQASRTGAPILALNIGEQLSSRYNVTFMCLTGGELIEDFCEVAVKVVDANLHSMESADYDSLIARLANDGAFSFAIVNSVECHAVLKPLHENAVPTVALLHEFSSYTVKKTAFPEAVRWADETVFSTRLTLENAFENNLLDFTPRLHVAPQGKCRIPSPPTSDAARTAEQNRLRQMLAPPGDRRAFVVLGAGTVEIRKGVDLFIEIATRVLSMPGAEHARFAWIGAGYAPERDYAYSVYLRDQLLRAGIENRVAILPATSEIEYAYELSDALLLPSRLDPLPNVGIDALSRGMPVLCFKEATGIADLLSEAGLEDECTADYIDTADMAAKLAALARSDELYQSVARRTKTYADSAIDIARYVSTIEALAVRARARAQNRAADAETIARSDAFRADFFGSGPISGKAGHEVANAYIERLGLVGAARKPEPGFNPFIYAESPESGYDGTSDAYADFLRKDRPAGPWLLPVLNGGVDAAAPARASALRSALHIHAYFTDGLAAVAQRLLANQTQPDLFISVGESADVASVKRVFDTYRGRVEIRHTPNMGRDIGPFLTAFGARLVAEYDVVGHIHIKKSSQLGDAAFVAAWSDFLLENVLGGSRGGRMLDRIMERFETDARVGLIYPDDPHIFGWTRNLRKAERIAARMGHTSLPKVINFPIGTMFWMRADVLRPFVELGLDWSDYPPEPLRDDGTDLHALERLFAVIPTLRGWDSVVTNIKGVTR